MLGLCAKAGKLSSGEFMAEKCVKEGRAFLVLVADDASDNTKKNFNDMSKYYNVPIRFYGNKIELGHAIGKEFRASVVVNDQGFADSIIKKIDAECEINSSENMEVVK